MFATRHGLQQNLAIPARKLSSGNNRRESCRLGFERSTAERFRVRFLTAFTDRRVTIYGEAGQPVHSSAGRRPADFEPIQLLCRAQTDHLALIFNWRADDLRVQEELESTEIRGWVTHAARLV